MSYLITLACLLISDVCIPMDCRVSNQNPGYCTWASLETLGKFLKIKPLYGLVESRKKDPDYVIRTWHQNFLYGPWEDSVVIPNNWGNVDAVKDKLSRLKVNCTIQRPGVFNTVLIEESLKNNLGCVITVNNGAPTCSGSHSVIVIDFNRTEYKYIDSNITQGVFTGVAGWFHQEWDGTVIVVKP